MKNHDEKVSKWSRNGTKTNDSSIQKHVTGNIMKIIKNHVSLNGKIIEIHCKNNYFQWFRRLHVRMEKVSNKHIWVDDEILLLCSSPVEIFQTRKSC